MPTLAPRPALIVTVLLAGCFGAVDPGDLGPDDAFVPGPATPRPDYDFGRAIVQDHDHGDRSLHTESYGLELVGFTALTEASAPGTLPGGYFELALVEGYAFVSNMGPDRAFTIADISDRANPRAVGHYTPDDALGLQRMAAGSYWDVAVWPDGDLAVLSAQALANPLGAMAGPDEVGGGLYLVNTEDKTRPFTESFTQVVDPGALIPVGVHNANPFQVDGVWYVAATTANGRTYLYEVVGEAPRRGLAYVSELRGMHDSAVQVHPLTGQTLLYTAHGGVYIWDIGDPANPVEVAFVQNGPDMSAYHETIPSNVLIDGRHYTVTGGESVEGDPTIFTILDTTEPEYAEIVGTWVLPGDLSGPGAFYTFSGHNFDVDRGRLYIGHYHAGVWVVDMSSQAHAREPFALAFYQPHQEAPYVPRTTKGNDNPSVWRATLHTDGLVWATDTNSGLYALAFTGPPSPYEDAPTFPHNIR